MSKASNRGRFFGRKRARPIEAAEKPMQEEQAPDPRMSAREWAEWLMLTSQLEEAEP
jgi:hypothetical protein